MRPTTLPKHPPGDRCRLCGAPLPKPHRGELRARMDLCSECGRGLSGEQGWG